MDTLERFRGALLGLAAGDAVGTTVEFEPRGTFSPVTDMVGGGPFALRPGQWTDDTSMALCLATSLVECRGFDARDQMRRYSDWRSRGYLSSTGTCFDIGNTVRDALGRFQATGEPFSGSTESRAAGNGSLMRLAPVPMFFFNRPDDAIRYAVESSRTTHAAQECLDACRLFADMLLRAVQGAGKEDVLCAETLTLASPKIAAIAAGAYRDKTIDEISGSGYVVHGLEAAVWCFWRTRSFEEAVLQAANWGDDADTTAAICGQLAGAHYGESGIPSHWRERLTQRELIGTLADRLHAFGAAATAPGT